jgi:hypothetical protein
MSSSQLGIVNSKRLKLNTGSPWPKAGFDLSTNGNRLRPDDPNGVIGSNSIPKSGGTNDDIHCKYIVVPTKVPDGNRWAETIPLGAVCFIRNLRARKRRAELFVVDDGGVRGIFKEAHRVEILTPERLNFTLHYDALQNKLRGMTRSLYDIFREWKVAGINGSPPVADHRPSPYINRLSEERYVDLRPLTDAHDVVNYWGEQVAGDVNAFLFFVLIEVTPGPETTYVTDIERDGVFNLPNTYRDDEEMRRMLKDTYLKEGNDPATADKLVNDNVGKYMRCPAVPRWVARYSNSKYLPMKEKAYTVFYRDPESTDSVEVEKFGYAVYIGRCKVNPVFDQKMATIKMDKAGDMCDMHKSNMLPKLDVQIDIQEKFLN